MVWQAKGVRLHLWVNNRRWRCGSVCDRLYGLGFVSCVYRCCCTELGNLYFQEEVASVKRVIVLLLLIVLALATSCSNNHQIREPRDSLSVSKYSDITDSFYEQTPCGYKAAFYDKSEITIERIIDWLDSCEPSEGFYQLVDLPHC